MTIILVIWSVFLCETVFVCTCSRLTVGGKENFVNRVLDIEDLVTLGSKHR